MACVQGRRKAGCGEWKPGAGGVEEDEEAVKDTARVGQGQRVMTQMPIGRLFGAQ